LKYKSRSQSLQYNMDYPSDISREEHQNANITKHKPA
jgi:hypothetical protein